MPSNRSSQEPPISRKVRVLARLITILIFLLIAFLAFGSIKLAHGFQPQPASPIDDAFNALLYGSGAILGEIIILILAIAFLKWEYGFVFSILIIFIFTMQLNAANVAIQGGGLGWEIVVNYLAMFFFLIYGTERLISAHRGSSSGGL